MDIAKAFNEFGRRVKLFGEGLKDITEGLGDGVKGLGIAAGVGITDIGVLIEYVFLFLGSYIVCGTYFLTQMSHCMIYYITEMLGQLLYLPVRIIAWILDTFLKINVYKYLDKIWYYMERIDKFIYKHCKFHIVHYPRSVRERCYICKRLKKQVIVRQGGVVDWDFQPNGGLVQIINKHGEQLIRGGKEINEVFS